MLIFDLNYLEVIDQEANIIGSGGVNSNSNIRKKVDIFKKVLVDIRKKVNSEANVKGHLAEAEALADAKGRNTLSETFTFSQTGNYGSSAASESTSATRNYYR